MTMHEALTGTQDMTIGNALRQAASLYASQPFFDDGDTVITFEDFDQLVDKLVMGLAQKGISAGDHVAIWLGNSLEWALLYFACGRLGAVMVPVNTHYTAREALYVLSQSDSKALVMPRVLHGKDYLETLLHIVPELGLQTTTHLTLQELPALKSIITVGESPSPFCSRFSDLIAAPVVTERLCQVEQKVHQNLVSIISYTSGTTGVPKGVMHDHRVLQQAMRVGVALDMRQGDAVLGHMPLYHVAGLYMGLVPAMLIGARFVNMRQWNAATALSLISARGVNIFGGIPTHFVDLCHSPELPRTDLSSMRNAWIGGSPVMQATFVDFKTKLCIKQLMSTYGMTENTISTTFNKLNDPIDLCCQNRAPVLGSTEVKVIDLETQQVCPPGKAGEIWCRGDTVMLGYYKNIDATHEVITHDGWLKTGDVGDMDEYGYIRITGRIKDMYKCGGTNVYPAEVEQVLSSHPSVRQVSIVGVPHERLGEVGYAFIQCNGESVITLEEITEHCKGKLAAYKLPHYINLIEDVPRTNTGKIKKSELIEIAKMHIGQKSKVRATETS